MVDCLGRPAQELLDALQGKAIKGLPVVGDEDTGVFDTADLLFSVDLFTFLGGVWVSGEEVGIGVREKDVVRLVT